jgi:hypothetical protein
MFAVTGVAVSVGTEVEVGGGVKVIVASGVTVTCGAEHPARIEVRSMCKRMDFFMNYSLTKQIFKV